MSIPNVGIPIEISYPSNEEFDYQVQLERIDLDKERASDLYASNGFIVASPNGVKKDLEDEDGIFSSRFGPKLKDMNTYIDRYKCRCGHLKYRLNQGMVCPLCNTTVERVNDNLGYFGWKVLKDPYHIIHPNLYKSIETFIGKEEILKNILSYYDQKNADGIIQEERDIPEDQPFFGIGMMAFKERFQEIMDYYYKASQYKSTKKAYYDDIMKESSKVFSQSIPVFTTLLRPVEGDRKNLYFEDTNATYNMINKLASSLNDDGLRMNRKKSSHQLLFDLQMKYNFLYDNIVAILEKKKGNIRGLLASRMNFTSRCVISAGPELRINQVKLPYACLLVLLQQRIVRVLEKTYSYSSNEAHRVWSRASVEKNDIIVDIIESFIKNDNNGQGVGVIINRNPSISMGSILSMKCVGINMENYTMSIPLQVLPLLAGDFDGDVLNIRLILTEEYGRLADEVFDPRQFYISRNDGSFNNDVNHARDTIININTLMNIGRKKYTKKDYLENKSIVNKR